MRKGKKSLVIILAIVMAFTSVPVSAAPMNGSSYTVAAKGGWFGNWWKDLFNWNWNTPSYGNDDSSEDTNDDVIVDTETEDSEEQETEQELVVVEDASTVENGDMLRATTYNLRTVDAGTEDAAYGIMTADETTGEETATDTTSTVKYFPVTMYNYKTDELNAATDALDDDLTLREGIYFTGGSPASNKTTETDMSAFIEGQYYIQNIRASENRDDGQSWLQAHADNKIYAVTKENATLWTLTIENDAYYLSTEIDETVYYMVVGTNGDNDGYSTTKTPVNLTAYSGNAEGVQISNNDYYLCQWGSATAQDFGGYNVNNDGGNGMRFYRVEGDTEVLATITVGEAVITSGYEEWNRWDKASGSNANGDLFYTGLAQNALVDDQIKFNVNEGGMFDNNTTVKDIYEYVGLPFVLKADGIYSFDSDANGVYFADTDNDGNADPKSGTANAPYNLYFDEGKTQPLNISVGDGSTNAFFPYNIYTTAEDGTKTYNQDIDYHFGMRADLPFSMTANGRIKSTDDSSDPIKFTFSGDDDVWVYIDGSLVIDLGGIHNRLDVTIDFAANTVTYSEENAADTNTATGSYNDANFATTQKLFTDTDGTGLINQTRDAFAAEEDHEMQVFYLERGEGTSNCRIEFNLPMHDTVLVTKDATKSWSETNKDDADEGVDLLTDAEQAIVNNIDFGFTLYKKDESTATFVPVANTNFYLIGRGVESTVINSTDANGHFYLRNGQSAKFITDIPSTGATYYVVEDTVPEGFVTPDFNYDGEATSGYDYNAATGTKHVTLGNEIPEQIIATNAEENKSYEVTVYGSIEANDSVEFICSNYLNAELPNPTAITMEDIIVIDYGLPVQIDPLANDIFRGENIEIVYVGGADVTLTETKDSNGVGQATWTEDATLDFGSFVKNDVDYSVSEDGKITRDTLTYTLNKQLTEVEVLTYIIKVSDTKANEATYAERVNYDYAIGKIYIVPATVMYYEENFSDLVTFTGSNWKDEVRSEKYVSDYQEPGVVGTTTDSTYGSDVAYLNDSEDSNGTSYYGDTTNGAIRFSYTFTGTGTSFFARTSATTGYMQVKLYEGTDITDSESMINITYRDTYYKDDNGTDEDADGTLYNIPVYTESDLDYGTYTVVVTVAKAGTKGAGENRQSSGKDFYLDGIRIMQPLNKSNATVINETTGETITDKALGAYATDGESNIEVVTLRQKLITDAELNETPWNFVVLTDTDGTIETAETYTSIGPKEEVYLEKGQTVSFAVKHWQLDGFKMYMGMKAPFGNGTVQVGQSTYNLANSADCYYDITKNYSSLVTKTGHIKDDNGNYLYVDGNDKQVYETKDGYYYYVSDNRELTDSEIESLVAVEGTYYVATYTFTATSEIVSLTNIKVTGNYEFDIVEDINESGNVEVNGEEGEEQ